MKHRSIVLLLSALLLCGCTVRDPNASAVTAAPAEAPASAPVADSLRALRITELMADNASPYADFRDWIELTNTGSEAVELTDCALSDREEEPLRWRFPALRLEGGERLIVYADGGSGQGLCADFSLSAKGETLTLSAPDGTALHRVSWEDAPENQSVCFEDGESRFCAYPTPGEENSYESWVRLQEKGENGSPLRINEAMSSNQSLLPQSDGECYDWVELKNVSGQPVELSGYYLSDTVTDAKRYALPALTLQPGELWLALCEKDAEAETLNLPTTGFALDAQAENLYLFDAKGRCLDWLYLWNIPHGGSMGRRDEENGSFYFLTPTPGAENGGECGRSRYPAPVGDVPSGVYENSEPLTLSLCGEGELHYTLDGSLPDADSPVYTGPLTLDRSTVVRAVALGSERLPGPVTTLHYILNEGEGLEVVSLAAPPEQFWDFYGGFDKEREEAVNAAYFGEYGSFTEDAGVTFHGNSELSPTGKQKGMTLRFRSRYGNDHVHCDLFGQGQEKIHSLVLRTGISREYYFWADPIYTALAEECADGLEHQRCDFVSVYVNGEYLGLFQLRDHLSRNYYAEKWNVPKESVEIIRISEMAGTELEALLRYACANNLNDGVCFAYVEERMDLKTLAQWMILQGYSGNVDLRTNVKFVRSDRADGKWHVQLFDLDRAMQNIVGLDVALTYYTEMNLLLPQFMNALCTAEGFRAVLKEQLAAMMPTLNEENFVSRLDALRESYDSEMIRSLTRWDYSVDRWTEGIGSLRALAESGRAELAMEESAARILQLSKEEVRKCFGKEGTE